MFHTELISSFFFLFLFPSIEQPNISQPNKRITCSHTACHNHHATQTLTQTTTSSIPEDNSTSPFTQQINDMNSTYRIPNNPTFENADYTEPHAQHRPQRKRRCELLDVTQCLPSLSLTPCALPTSNKNFGDTEKTRPSL